MTVAARPSPRARMRSPSEAGARRIRWWHYVLAATALLVLAGLAYGVYAIWFSVTHVRTSYARISGYMMSVSANYDTRVKRLLVRTGDRVKKGQPVAELDNAGIAAEVEQGKATLAQRDSDLRRAQEDLDRTIRDTATNVEEADAMLRASRARLSQASAEMEMGVRTQPDEVKRAKADVASAKAKLAQLQAGPRPQEIEQEKALVAAAEAQLGNASATLRRMEKLQKDGAVSAQQLDTARSDREVAQATVNAQRQKLSLLQAGSRSEDIEAAKQAVASAEAALAVAVSKSYENQMKAQAVATRVAESRQAEAGLKRARSQKSDVALKEQDVLAKRAAVAEARAALSAVQARLSDTELRSSENGIVILGRGPSVHEGEVIVSGTPVVTIAATDVPLWITSSVSELLVAKVREGQPATIGIDAFKGRTFTGKVTQVGGATEMTADETPWSLKQIPVRLSFDSRDVADQIKPGMSCRVWIDVRK